VTSEVTLAVVALIGAGLFVKSFQLARAIQPGFDPHQVAIAQMNLSAAGYDARQADTFCTRLREGLERQPGVTAVSYGDYIPLSVAAGSWEDLQIQGYVPGPNENMKFYRNLVAPGYFDLMKIPLLQGRDFNLRDTRGGSGRCGLRADQCTAQHANQGSANLVRNHFRCLFHVFVFERFPAQKWLRMCF